MNKIKTGLNLAKKSGRFSRRFFCSGTKVEDYHDDYWDKGIQAKGDNVL